CARHDYGMSFISLDVW
nr:immunoglobulin heavy chain junction region [Macaca mulatta]MOW24589.1 immunoglobulin heavy chain junction region [Macaca mulatta]